MDYCWHRHTRGSNQTLLLVDVLLVGRLVRRGLDVCVLDGVELLLHGHVDGRLVLAHVHVSSVTLASKRHIAVGWRGWGGRGVCQV